MSISETILASLTAAIGKELSRQLVTDARSWLASQLHRLTKLRKKLTTDIYKGPAEITQALSAGVIGDGDRVTLRCKPSSLGPFLRYHFMSPFAGDSPDLRLGPQLRHQNPFMEIVGNSVCHLAPVGVYPPLTEGTTQVCLYPSDARACGFISCVPDIRSLIPWLPGLFASRHIQFLNMPCHVTGHVRLLPPGLVTKLGMKPEYYEELRQLGKLWVIDATDDESECTPLDDGIVTELWGGLYASGHVEIAEKGLDLRQVTDAFSKALRDCGFDARSTQNLVRRREVLVYAKGCRACVDGMAPFWSLHMDAEMALEYAASRKRFDQLIDAVLRNLRDLCKAESVPLRNPLDVDFSYSDSIRAYTVLRSGGAEEIRDPLAIVIRDWHRRRSDGTPSAAY